MSVLEEHFCPIDLSNPKKLLAENQLEFPQLFSFIKTMSSWYTNKN